MTRKPRPAATALLGGLVLALPLLVRPPAARAGDAPPAGPAIPADIRIDASKVENPISPLMYGQFLEYMFQCIKGGLHGELVRDRSFEEPADSLGLPRDWERYPDRRNDDPSLAFSWD